MLHRTGIHINADKAVQRIPAVKFAPWGNFGEGLLAPRGGIGSAGTVICSQFLRPGTDGADGVAEAAAADRTRILTQGFGKCTRPGRRVVNIKLLFRTLFGIAAAATVPPGVAASRIPL